MQYQPSSQISFQLTLVTWFLLLVFLYLVHVHFFALNADEVTFATRNSWYKFCSSFSSFHWGGYFRWRRGCWPLSSSSILSPSTLALLSSMGDKTILHRTSWHQTSWHPHNLAPGEFGTWTIRHQGKWTIWHRIIWHQDNLAPT